MRPIVRSRTRFAVLLGAAAAAAAIAGAVIASAGAAQGPPTTLHLVATAQRNIGFAPDHAPPTRQGDRFGGGARITGDDTGIQRSVCTAIGKRALCNIQMNLSRGRLSAQGLVPNQTDQTPIPLTGGTGAYNGARGTILTTQVTPTKVRFTVRLLH
jgi:hypothetical protein